MSQHFTILLSIFGGVAKGSRLLCRTALEGLISGPVVANLTRFSLKESYSQSLIKDVRFTNPPRSLCEDIVCSLVMGSASILIPLAVHWTIK